MPDQKIISIHIPKTAGTSFRLLLESIYGNKGIQTFYGSREDLNIRKNVNLIHGHISSSQLERIIQENPEWEKAKVIVWIRDPVDRFFSNYHYLRAVTENYLKTANAKPSISKRMLKTLEEYSRTKQECNRMSGFLDFRTLNERRKLLFVGRCEHFEEDFAILVKLLGWRKYYIPYVNETKDKPTITDEQRQEIIKHNQEDMEWYRELLDWAENNNRKSQ